MRIVLLENQIDIILKSLENYTKNNPEKLQLIWATYQSLLYQKTEKTSVLKCNTNVTINFQKTIYK